MVRQVGSFCAGEGAGVARIWEGKVGCYVCIVRRACGSYWYLR